MRNHFEFSDSWLTPAAVDDVAGAVTDLEHYPDWWPEVRAVARLGPDTAWVRCRSVLPYTLDLVLDSVSQTPPALEVAIGGDLTGFARFTLSACDGGTRIDFQQEVRARGLLGLASYVLRPVLVWNHERMMASCRDGLSARLTGSGALLLDELRP
ncbi:MAG TPA: SRPBCC family protein [Nocardioides sp.]|nr:SRPBCC family protein [Nocardioides sp.]